MIDQNKKPSALEVAKEIAKQYINRAKEEGYTEIYVINKDRSVYLNSNLETIQEMALRTGAQVTVVMENGKLRGEDASEETDEAKETPKKKNTKK